MKTSRFTKILLSAALLTGLGHSAFAVDYNNPEDSYLQCGLATYFELLQEPTPGTITPTSGALSAATIADFTVSTNQTDRALDITATVKTGTGATTSTAFFGDTDQVYVVLGNTTNYPSDAAVLDCKGGSTSPADNANAIAYPLTATYDSASIASYFLTDNFNDVVVAPGIKHAILSIPSGTAATGTAFSPGGTYSYEDTSGTYQADITVTGVTLI